MLRGLEFFFMTRDMVRFDTGTLDSMDSAAAFVRVMKKNQIKILLIYMVLLVNSRC